MNFAENPANTESFMKNKIQIINWWKLHVKWIGVLGAD